MIDIKKLPISEISNEKSNDILSKNVKITDVLLDPRRDKQSIRFATLCGQNNNDQSVSIKLIKYYTGSNGKKHDSSTCIEVIANSEFTVLIDSTVIKIEYYVEKKDPVMYHPSEYIKEVNISKLKIKTKFVPVWNKNEGAIEITVTNTLLDEIESLDIACYYYKKGKLIYAAHEGMYFINPKETKSKRVYDYLVDINNPEEGEHSPTKLDYDDYKVVIYNGRKRVPSAITGIKYDNNKMEIYAFITAFIILSIPFLSNDRVSYKNLISSISLSLIAFSLGVKWIRKKIYLKEEKNKYILELVVLIIIEIILSLIFDL